MRAIGWLVGAMATCSGGAPIQADTAAAFAEANMVAAFYHEAAHALIDRLDLTVPGSEEDAADALAAVLIHRLHDEAEATELVTDAALAFRLFDAADKGGMPPLRTAHSIDMARHHTLVCLFYGADPGRRGPVADDLGLPRKGRDGCPAAWRSAADGWGALLAGMPPQDHLAGFRLVTGTDTPLAARIAREVAALNGEFGLALRIDVVIERCGEATAFYDPRAGRIVLCTEYADALERLYRGALP